MAPNRVLFSLIFIEMPPVGGKVRSGTSKRCSAPGSASCSGRNSLLNRNFSSAFNSGTRM